MYNPNGWKTRRKPNHPPEQRQLIYITRSNMVIERKVYLKEGMLENFCSFWSLARIP
jgi:hypothetical protein